MLVCDARLLVQDPSLTSGAWPVSYETVGSTSGAIERRTPSSGKLSLIRSLRDQLQNTQRQLKVVTANVNVALSKASHAADCEKFLLDEIENLGKSLKCESLNLFRCVLTWCVGFDLRSLFADVCLDSAAEARLVNAHLVAAQTHANSVADNFWADRSKAMKLTLLQDRISQAGVLAEMSRSALALVYQAMFPLNQQPEGLPALLDQFENGNAVYFFVREHLRCGAVVALAFVRAHYPEVDLELLKTLPPSPSGRYHMEHHYAACRGTGDCIARQIVIESDWQRENQGAVAP
jgi:hypothetical protein